jgi:hypothetical protein
MCGCEETNNNRTNSSSRTYCREKIRHNDTYNYRTSSGTCSGTNSRTFNPKWAEGYDCETNSDDESTPTSNNNCTGNSRSRTNSRSRSRTRSRTTYNNCNGINGLGANTNNNCNGINGLGANTNNNCNGINGLGGTTNNNCNGISSRLMTRTGTRTRTITTNNNNCNGTNGILTNGTVNNNDINITCIVPKLINKSMSGDPLTSVVYNGACVETSNVLLRTNNNYNNYRQVLNNETRICELLDEIDDLSYRNRQKLDRIKNFLE